MTHICRTTLIGAALLIASGAAAVGAPDLTADEILAKSEATMAAPIQYRMVMGGVDSIVSMKDLGGEIGVATRVETINPHIEQISIATAKYAYEWRPKTGLAIDKTLLGEAMLAQAAAIKQSIPAGATRRLLEPETIDGVEHYVIETTVPQGLTDAIAKMLSMTNRLSGTSRSWINAKTFRFRKMVNAAGEIDYLDVKPGIELPNDLFLPPEGMTFEKPKTVDEYIKILTESSRPKPKPLVKVEPRADTAPPFWDPEAKTWKASAPPGRDQKEWEAYIASMPSPPPAHDQPAKPTKGQNSRLLYGILVILAALGTYAIIRWRRLSGRR